MVTFLTFNKILSSHCLIENYNLSLVNILGTSLKNITVFIQTIPKSKLLAKLISKI